MLLMLYKILVVCAGAGLKEGKTVCKSINNASKSPYYAYNKYRVESPPSSAAAVGGGGSKPLEKLL